MMGHEIRMGDGKGMVERAFLQGIIITCVLTDLDYSNAHVYVYSNQCRYNYPLRKRSFCVATGSYWRVF